MQDRWRRRVLGGLLSGALVAGATVTTGGTAAAAPGESYALTGSVTGGGEAVYAHLELFRENGSGFDHLRTLHTDGAGNTFSTGVEDGVYKLSIEDEDDERYATEWYDDASSLETATEIVVDGGSVDLGEIELAPRPAITGRVTDAAGKPVRNVRVATYDPEVPWDGYRDSSWTDRQGRFHLTPEDGDWLVEFRDDRDEYATEWYGDAPTAEGATVVSFSGEESVDLGTVTLTGGSSIAGRVTESSGAGIVGVQVELYHEGEHVTTIATDRAGDYVIPRVLPGSYELEFVDGQLEFASEYWNDAPTWEDATPVVVARDQAVTGINAVLAPRAPEDPVGVDATGLVVDAAGKPLRGVRVGAVNDAPEPDLVDMGVTDRNGRYQLRKLDAASLGDGGYDPTATSFRLFFVDESDHDLPYVQTWLGGALSYARSAKVTVPAGGTATAPTTALQRYTGVRGTLASVYGELDWGSVVAYDADGDRTDSYDVSRTGRFEIPWLLPGEPYRLVFEGELDDHRLIRTWWRSGSNYATATPVVGRSGVWTTGVDVALTDKLTATTAPTISGSPLVGGTLTASNGAWNLSVGADWTYAWLRGGTVVGTGRTYRPTVADAGSRLTVRVTNWIQDLSGTATSAATGVVRQTSRSVATAAYNRKKRKLTLTVKVNAAGIANPGGTVTVREGSKTVKAGVRLVNGVAKVTLKKPKKGKRAYAVSYSGTAAVLPSNATVSVRVK
ncbi:MAG TPA: carboxypeptidase regulatory-like domain-containing protein [Nocardioides sp.]|uniref:carboxypeptidase regulatory-like domain-containing protein n=1 Tax=Nocardioides sp. TaxID=35761 RepID=UPI002C8DDDDC|nr:carboxypeptidase regulatory-like domain-containing protein [Nocardioides sp.]HTW17577.1 carboxypeptidase regulatory-like domain-containing protein [Nocardioides sp.]